MRNIEKEKVRYDHKSLILFDPKQAKRQGRKKVCLLNEKIHLLQFFLSTVWGESEIYCCLREKKRKKIWLRRKFL